VTSDSTRDVRSFISASASAVIALPVSGIALAVPGMIGMLGCLAAVAAAANGGVVAAAAALFVVAAADAVMAGGRVVALFLPQIL
jgi:hypothetical protein